MIEGNLSLIERDVTKISPKIRLHRDMRRTVSTLNIPYISLVFVLDELLIKGRLLYINSVDVFEIIGFRPKMSNGLFNTFFDVFIV